MTTGGSEVSGDVDGNRPAAPASPGGSASEAGPGAQESSPSWDRLREVAARLSAVSRAERYDVYQLFKWPESLPPDTYWMSPELTTCYGTELWARLDEPSRIRLSHFEAVNFFSLNIHLIRELIGEVADRIYATRYPGLSEFFHDFIHEENEHMWFFAQFCQRYGGKVYPARKFAPAASGSQDTVADLMVFGRILIAEELCDVFNARMAGDSRLPPIALKINAVHHNDESRHIAFGRQMMRTLHDDATASSSPEQMRAVGEYLGRYITVCLRSFYNPAMYRDAGLDDVRRIRPALLADPARHEVHQQLMGRTVGFLNRVGLVDPAMVEW